MKFGSVTSPLLCFMLLTLLKPFHMVHLTKENMKNIVRFINSAHVQRIKRQAITDPQPWLGPPGQIRILNVPIPTNIGHFPGMNNPIMDACPRDQIEMETDGSCQYAMAQGQCEVTEQVILSPETSRGFCAPRLCPPDRIFLPSTQMCHDPREVNICPPGRELYYSVYGTPVCTCPDGTVEGDDDLDDDVCEVLLGSSLLCMPGQVFWFYDFNSPPKCMADPCGGKNLYKGANQLPFVPSEIDGVCYQLGTSTGLCPENQYYSLSYESLRGKCATLEEAGYMIFDQQMLAALQDHFRPSISSYSHGPAYPLNNMSANMGNYGKSPLQTQHNFVNAHQNYFVNGPTTNSIGTISPTYEQPNRFSGHVQVSLSPYQSSQPLSTPSVFRPGNTQASSYHTQSRDNNVIRGNNQDGFSTYSNNNGQQTFNPQFTSSFNVGRTQGGYQQHNNQNSRGQGAGFNQAQNNNQVSFNQVTNSYQSGQNFAQNQVTQNYHISNNGGGQHNHAASGNGNNRPVFQFQGNSFNPMTNNNGHTVGSFQYHDRNQLQSVTIRQDFPNSVQPSQTFGHSQGYQSTPSYNGQPTQSQFHSTNNINQNGFHTQTTSSQLQFQGNAYVPEISIEVFGPEVNSPEVYGSGGNNQQSIELFDQYYGQRLGRSLGVREPPIQARLALKWKIFSDGSVYPQFFHSRAIRSISVNRVNDKALIEATRTVGKAHSRKKRQTLPYASPSNVFETRLLGCRAGAVRDINAKCRNTILPARIPKTRGTRSAPPIPPTPTCGEGMAFNIQRKCVAANTAQNSIVAFRLG